MASHKTGFLLYPKFFYTFLWLNDASDFLCLYARRFIVAKGPELCLEEAIDLYTNYHYNIDGEKQQLY